MRIKNKPIYKNMLDQIVYQKIRQYHHLNKKNNNFVTFYLGILIKITIGKI